MLLDLQSSVSLSFVCKFHADVKYIGGLFLWRSPVPFRYNIQKIALSQSDKHEWFSRPIFFALIHNTNIPATQNMDKHIHDEKLKVLTNISYCFFVSVFVIVSYILLTFDITLHSRKFPTKPSVHTYNCLTMLFCKFSHLSN